MKFSPQQDKALVAVKDWIEQGKKPFFYLGGYAGTGKTTLAKHFTEGMRNVTYAAFTGKAALQLEKSGIPHASTVHSLIYKLVLPDREKILEMEAKLAAAQDPEEAEECFRELKKLREPHFELNPDSDLLDSDLLVLDECSMINQEMADDLLDFEVPILVLGDPGQLPPGQTNGVHQAGQAP